MSEASSQGARMSSVSTALSTQLVDISSGSRPPAMPSSKRLRRNVTQLRLSPSANSTRLTSAASRSWSNSGPLLTPESKRFAGLPMLLHCPDRYLPCNCCLIAGKGRTLRQFAVITMQ
jgi:hypothetical protein